MDVVVRNKELSSPTARCASQVCKNGRPDDLRGGLRHFALTSRGSPDNLSAERVATRRHGNDGAAYGVFPQTLDWLVRR